MNWEKKLKNPYFWVTMIGLFFSSTGVDPTNMESWSVLGDAIMRVASSPFLLGSFALAVLGQVMNHATKGLKD